MTGSLEDIIFMQIFQSLAPYLVHPKTNKCLLINSCLKSLYEKMLFQLIKNNLVVHTDVIKTHVLII